MPETPIEHEGQDFVVPTEGVMTNEQQRASEFREQRIKMLGEGGTLKRQSTTKDGYSDEYLRGTIKGHEVVLLKTSDKQSSVYSGQIDQTGLSPEESQQLWDRVSPYSNEVDQEHTSDASFSLANENARQVIAERENAKGSLLTELLSDGLE